MSKSESRQISIFFGDVAEFINDVREVSADEFSGVAYDDEFGVVGDFTACGSEVDDSSGSGRGVGEGVDVSHDVVAKLAFILLGFGEIDIVEVGSHFIDCFFWDVEA